MGGCLTCCQHRNDHPRQQNGHPGTSCTPSKVSGPAHSYALVPTSHPPFHPEVVQLPTRTYAGPGAGEPLIALGNKLHTNGDSRKMFGQYPKLPPIRNKHNGSDFKRSSLTSRDVSDSKINALFEMYKDPTEDFILAEGIENLCRDLDVRPEEFKVLVLAWKFDAETMCRFSRSEFVQGCHRIRADSIKSIQARLPELQIEVVQNRQTFKEFYRWTYRFGLDSDVGQRTLPLDIAVSLWQLVFSQNEPPILKRWLGFLEWQPSVRGIPRDTWDMFLNFVDIVKGDLSNYDDTEAWPSLFDDFVECENDRENQNVQLDKSLKDDME